MSEGGIRIAMWSGPRNISTAMMRSFENRPDTSVIDEPFYAYYLDQTGADHPMRDVVLASQSRDWRDVVARLLGPIPKARSIFYQKHMIHHLLSDIDRAWVSGMRNAFLIREPNDVLLSYVEVRGSATPEEIGIPQLRQLFEREADRLGYAPPVIDTHDVLCNPRQVLTALCRALGIEFRDAMLSWPSGRRDSDGVWAPAWYGSVERSTGFGAPMQAKRHLPDELKRVSELVRDDYERLSTFKLS